MSRVFVSGLEDIRKTQKMVVDTFWLIYINIHIYMN